MLMQTLLHCSLTFHTLRSCLPDRLAKQGLSIIRFFSTYSSAKHADKAE